MKNFKFKSAICTSVEQSKRLLELGLKKETADCMYSVMTKSYNGHYILEQDRQYNLILFRQKEVQSVGFSHYEYIPAWSLHRLIEIDNVGVIEFFNNDIPNIYDRILDYIERRIKMGLISPEYLEE